MLLGGAAINRAFTYRAVYVNGKDDDTVYEPGRLLLQGRLRGPGRDGPARRRRTPRRSSSSKVLEGAHKQRNKIEVVEDLPPTDDDSVRSPAATDAPVPSRRSGASARFPSTRTSCTATSTRHVLFKLHWGGRGVKGDAWKAPVEGSVEDDGTEIEGFLPKL